MGADTRTLSLNPYFLLDCLNADPGPHVVQDREPLSEKSLLVVKSDFRFACSWVQQFGILMRRAWLQTSRDKLPLIVTGIQVGLMLISACTFAAHGKLDLLATLGKSDRDVALCRRLSRAA